MTYSIYQHWDPLKVCVVGRSYPPEFYSFITNQRVRFVMERIAQETEEDYQKLIKLLESFNVKVLRPNIGNDFNRFLVNGKYLPPPMTPRDYTMVLGQDVYFKAETASDSINPSHDTNNYNEITQFIWGDILNDIQAQGNNLFNTVNKDMLNLNSASEIRCGRDIYIGNKFYGENKENTRRILSDLYPEFRFHTMDTGGHSDGTYCPVVPGLVLCHNDITPSYAEAFPDWEVVYVPGPGWEMFSNNFLNLKEKNQGKWWVPGEELNDDFTNFIESWLGHWVGYVEETVFDVNILVIDEKNVVCNDYTDQNKHVFDALERRGITPHIINFRHRNFWDGGIHCITADLHCEGRLNDYFPNLAR